MWRCILLSYQQALPRWGIEGEDESIMQLNRSSEPGSLKPTRLSDLHGFQNARVVPVPESVSYRDQVLFSWKDIPCSTIAVWSVSRGKEDAGHPVAEDQRGVQLVSTGTKQNEYSKPQRGTPSLLHTQKDFPVVQPAVVVRVSVNLAERRNTAIRMDNPHAKPPGSATV